MKTTRTKPVRSKVRFTVSAIAKLIEMGWIIDTVEDGVEVRTVDLPPSESYAEDPIGNDWPDIIGD
jgi:hypothetical protein